MIPGIVAATGNGSSAGGSSYPDALAVADFILGEYFVDGNQLTAADMIDKPGNIVPGSGLSVDWDVAGDVVAPIGGFLAKLCLAEFTIVVEAWEHADTGGATTDWIHAQLSTGPFDFTWFVQASDSGAAGDSDNIDGIGGGRYSFVSAPITKPAIRRIAMTRTSDRLSVSSNGSAVTTDTTSWPGGASAMDQVQFGALLGNANPNFKGYFRRIIVYPVQSDAQLPALSTP